MKFLSGGVEGCGGGGVGGYLAGQAVFRGAGWSEWKARYPGITAKATNQQQFNCHVTAGVYGLPFTKDYNLEQVRANFPNWLPTVAKHRATGNYKRLAAC